MAKIIKRYATVRELAEMLRDAELSASQRDRIFMLPSHANDELLLDLLRDDGIYFGERPTIWSWSDLYRALVPHTLIRRQIDPPDHMLVLRYVIDLLLKDLDARDVSIPEGVRRRGFANIVSSSIRELMLEGVAPDQVIRKDASDKDAPIAPDELLHMIYGDYSSYLDSHSLADSAALASYTLDDMDRDAAAKLLNEHEVCWIGFLTFTGTQRRLARALSALVQNDCVMRFYVPDCGLAGLLDAASQMDPNGATSVFHSEIPITISQSADMYEQYDEAASFIARRSDASNSRDAGVLVAHGRAQLMEAALTKRGIASQTRVEMSVSQTEIMRIPLKAWELHKTFWPTEQTHALLSSPALGAERLDIEAIHARMPEGADGWRDLLKNYPRASAGFESLVSFCEFLDDEDGHTPLEIFEAFCAISSEDKAINIAGDIKDRYELDGSVRQTASAAVEAAEKCRLLSELARQIGDAADIRMRGDDAVDHLRSWSEEASGAFAPPMSGAVKIYEGAPPVLASHDVWVMTDVEAGNFPGPVKDDPLLNSDDRERINASSEDSGEGTHLTTLLEKRMQKEALFRRLVCTGTSAVLLIRSERDGEGREVPESPFVSSIRSSPSWSTIVEEDKFARRDRYSGAAKVERGIFPRAARSELATKKRVGASFLDTWRKCKFMFWVDCLSEIRDAQDEADMFSPLKKGSVVHEIWASLWDIKKRTGEPLIKLIHEDWDAEIKKNESRFPFVADPRASITMSMMRSSMIDMAMLQDEIESNASAKGLTRSDTIVERPLDAIEMENVIFMGRADRIDVWDGVGAVIVDYKSGASDKYKDSIQLGCYANMLGASLGVDVAGVCFLGHKDCGSTGAWKDEKIASVYGDKRKNITSIDDVMQSASDAMREIDAHIAKCEFEADAKDDDVCKVCRHGQICRRSEWRGTILKGEDGDDDE